MLVDALIRQPQKYQGRPVEPQHVGIVQAPDPRAELRAGHRRDLVDHRVGGLFQSVTRRRCDGKPEQRRLRRIGGERTDRDRIAGFEPVGLGDDDRPGLAGIVPGAGSGPYLAAIHPSLIMEMSSTNA